MVHTHWYLLTGQCLRHNYPSKVLSIFITQVSHMLSNLRQGPTLKEVAFAGFPGSNNRVEAILPRP